MSSSCQTVGPRQRRAPLCGALKHCFTNLSSWDAMALRRSDLGGQNSAQKLVYILLYLQHRVSVAGEVIAQSYEPDKMRCDRSASGWSPSKPQTLCRHIEQIGSFKAA